MLLSTFVKNSLFIIILEVGNEIFKFTNLTLEGPCIIFCNIYTFQQDTQRSCTDEVFNSNQMSALHVSDRNGPSSGASL